MFPTFSLLLGVQGGILDTLEALRDTLEFSLATQLRSQMLQRRPKSSMSRKVMRGTRASVSPSTLRCDTVSNHHFETP